MDHWYNDNHPRCFFTASTIIRLVIVLLSLVFMITLCSLMINKKVTADSGLNSTLGHETNHTSNFSKAVTVLDEESHNFLDDLTSDTDQLVSDETTTSSDANPRWPLCQDILKQINADLLQNVNYTYLEIEETIKDVCLKLHTDVFQDCVRNVNTFGKALLFLLEVDFDYKYVCPSLEACFKPITNVSKNQLIKDDMNETCSQCELIMYNLEKRIINYGKEDLTAKWIGRSLVDICVSRKDRKKCAGFIDSHADEIVNYFMTRLTPYNGCGALEMCPDDFEGDLYYSAICFQLSLF